MEPLNDAANCLRLKDRHDLIHQLESLNQEFPQIFFCVFLGILPPHPTLAETSFWLLNHAAFPSQEHPRLNEYAILLMIDPVAKCAGVNVGYALEAALPPKVLTRILSNMRTPLWHGEFATGISQALDEMSKILRKAGRRTAKRQEFQPPDAEASFLRAARLEPLRHTKAQSKHDVLNSVVPAPDPPPAEYTLPSQERP